jgi:hypothetical protein
MKNWPRWRNLTWATASQSHRICVAGLSSSRHLLQMGSSVNPNLKRFPFRWQCPVSSPTTHLNWSLLSLNRSFVLLAEGPLSVGKSTTYQSNNMVCLRHKLYQDTQLSKLYIPVFSNKMNYSSTGYVVHGTSMTSSLIPFEQVSTGLSLLYHWR